MKLSSIEPPAVDSEDGTSPRSDGEGSGPLVVRPLQVSLPQDGRLPNSEAWLARLYEHDRVPKEKKPPIFDHRRSHGPWLCSIDEFPFCIRDAMSQTATLPFGFSPDGVVAGYVDGEFGEHLFFAFDSNAEQPEALARFADALRAQVKGLPHVSFANSGAEACEKALSLCYLNRSAPNATRILAFEGSFHGRTLLALHTTYNATKRKPFEFEDYLATFAPFPGTKEEDPHLVFADEPWLQAIAQRDFDPAKARGDLLAEQELRILQQIDESLNTGQYFACMVEPMQSEGGDRYATSRFHQSLRVLTRAHDVPLIMDEVQCGLGLGGPFFWHSRFRLRDDRGSQDGPDCLCVAKRAQIGAVLSVFEDPEPTAAHVASAIRGTIFMRRLPAEGDAARIQGHARLRLPQLRDAFPALVLAPRAQGFAFAFDLPSPDHLRRFLGQRFWRGMVVYGAGSQTARFRLNPSFSERDVEAVFHAVEESLRWMSDHEGQDPPQWRNPTQPKHTLPEVRAARRGVRLLDVSSEPVERWLPTIMELENSVYEPARRDPPELMQIAFDDPDGVVCLAMDTESNLLGVAMTAPLEHFTTRAGPDRDPMQGKHNTAYMMTLAVSHDARGLGLGRRLKEEVVRKAAQIRTEQGQPRYRHICGRMRLGATAPVQRINRSLGAYELYRVEHQYQGEATAIYYRMPVGPFRCEETPPTQRDPWDFRHSLVAPLARAPETLVQAEKHGALFGPAVNKLTLTNFVTKASIEAVESIASLCRELPHLLLSSGRDEAIDKAIRACRYHRPEARCVAGVAGGYVGHSTAAARSVSDPCTHRAGEPFFQDWLRLCHPNDGRFEQEFQQALIHIGGQNRMVALIVETVQERTGEVLTPNALQILQTIQEQNGIPVVLVESASAYFRSLRGPFWSSSESFIPKVRVWWPGGQLGITHLADDIFVATPLTMVSTWDGDELSLLRTHHQLAEASSMNLRPLADALDSEMKRFADAGFSVSGAGLYRTIGPTSTKDSSSIQRLVERFARQKIHVRLFPTGIVALAPPLDLDPNELRLRLSACHHNSVNPQH